MSTYSIWQQQEALTQQRYVFETCLCLQLLVGAIDSSYDEQDEEVKQRKSKAKSFLGGLFK